MRYALPDVGSLEWYATPLNAAVADLDRRVHTVERTDPVPGTPGEKWFSNTGPPAPGIGVIGDWYLNTANGDVHEKTGASAWTLRGNVRGPAGAAGAAGAPGTPGTPGSSGGFYHHIQGTVSASWPIQHNLGFNPGVTVRDSAGTSWEGDITYDDINHLTVSFSAPFSGVADLS